MTTIRAGSESGSSLVLYPSQPTRSRNSSGTWTLKYKYWCKSSAAKDSGDDGDLPANASAPPDGDFSDLELNQVTVTPQVQNPSMVDVELTYTLPNSSPSFPLSEGEVRFESDVTLQDADIIEKAIEDEWSESAKEDAIVTRQKKTYLAPVPTFRRIENAASVSFSEANIIENVGVRDTPTGMISPTADKWIKSRKSMVQQGSRTLITQEWWYSTSAWAGEEYAP